MRSTGPPAQRPQTRLQRALTLFVMVATVLLALGTVVVAAYIYQPDLDFLAFFWPGERNGEGAAPPAGEVRGTPLGEILAERVPLGTPGAGQDAIGGPTIEPGSAIQLTIEPLEDGEALSPLPTGEPATVQQPTQATQPTEAGQPSPEPPSSQPTGEVQSPPEATPVDQPTQEPPAAPPTAQPTQLPPTQPPPTAAPTSAPAFDPQDVLAEIGFEDQGASTTGEQTVSVYIYNFSTQGFAVTTSDVALAPPGGENLAPVASSPILPVQVSPGQTVEITFTFPVPASGEGTFKLFTVEFDLGDF
jgi:outer membrane biosynthesis protein TonB